MSEDNGFLDLVLGRYTYGNSPPSVYYIGIYRQEYPLSSLQVRGSTFEEFEKSLVKAVKGRRFRPKKPDEQFIRDFANQVTRIPDDEFDALAKIINANNRKLSRKSRSI